MPTSVLRRLYAIDGVSGTRAAVVPETSFERPLDAGRTPSSGPVSRSS